ncbi:MAG: right-handed parallel beta-helix repeat-containing protein [Halioglobus sp.]|nr:right-handed parallel beta-helix repeat-containing protein [Halioglobus sp.]
MTISKLLPGLALLLSCHLVLPSAASAANYYVHASKGSNSSSGKAPDAAFRDLSYAIRRLRAGDTLFVRAGTYREKMSSLSASGTRSAPIVVKAYGNEKPIIRTSNITVLANANWWVFEGLTFQTSEQIRLGERTRLSCHSWANNITFRRNTFQNSSANALVLNCARQINIDSNVFFNIRSRQISKDAYGVKSTVAAHNIVISNNRFTDIGGDGIQLVGDVRNVQIIDNEFEVVHPYRYRTENGNVDSSNPKRFGSVGENAIDLKGGPGPFTIAGNVIHGFRPTIKGTQDASGAMGVGITMSHANDRSVYIYKNHFYDNVYDIKINGHETRSEIAYNIFENSVVADPTVYGKKTQTPRALHLENTGNSRVYNNIFHNDVAGDKILLFIDGVRNVLLQNNVFSNGRMGGKGGQFSSDHNAFSGITDKMDDNFNGVRDVTGNLRMNWSTWKPRSNSPLIDAGMRVQNSLQTDYYAVSDFFGAPIRGLGPDIGATEFGGKPLQGAPPPGCL